MSEAKAKPEKEPGAKKGPPIMPIIGIVLVLNLVLVGKVFMGGKDKGGKEVAKTGPLVEEVGKKMPLDEFFVNLEASNEHYLKITVALGLKKGEDEKKMEEEVAPMRDAILSCLTTKKLDQLVTADSKEKLKAEIKEKINKELGGDKIAKVYFTAFATQ